MIDLLAFIVTLGILVTIHEYGHFWVARRCGIKVLRFSVGFGKALFRWHDRHGTEFCLAAIPLGGYVKMLDEREGTVEKNEQHLAFNRKPVLQRIAVVIAGPVANLLLAVLVFWAIFLGGERGLNAVVASVEPNSLAEQAGIEAGDLIVAVDGIATPNRRDLMMALLNRLGESGSISIETQSQSQSFLELTEAELSETKVGHAELNNWLNGEESPKVFSALGISLYAPDILPILGHVKEGSPADRAGLKKQDKLLGAQGTLITQWSDWVEVFQSHAGRMVELEVEREGSRLYLSVTPDEVVLDDGSSIGRIGILPTQAEWPEAMLKSIEHNPLSAFTVAVRETWDNSKFVLLSIKKLIMGQISTKSLSGPISIAKVAGASAESGLLAFFTTLAMLSITLGVLNLLPIPVLDGGHLLYYLVELVKGSPLPDKIQIVGYQMGMFLLMGVMSLALYNDIMRL